MPKHILLKINLLGLILMGQLFVLSGKIDLNKIAENAGLKENEKRITLVAVGDIMLSRSVEVKMIEKKNFKYPFLKTALFTSGADITFGNLESPLVSGAIVYPTEMSFRADPKSVSGLLFGGFDVLSIANNHMMNQGENGLRETIRNLDENGILHAGAGIGSENISKSADMIVKGVKFSFLAYTYNNDLKKDSDGTEYGVSSMDIERMKTEVATARQKSDVVVVSMHAGTEYKKESGVFQQNFAHSAIDAGADLVIGHHPHVVEETEIYKSKYIIYSLGNFVFDQMWSEETRLGAEAEITFEGKEIKSVRFYPVKIYEYSQPQLISGDEGKAVVERIKPRQAP